MSKSKKLILYLVLFYFLGLQKEEKQDLLMIIKFALLKIGLIKKI